MKAILYTDGSSLGNPGPSGIGIILSSQEETAEFSFHIGNTTNNVAEYHALVTALQIARSKGYSDIEVNSDSQLMVNQVAGKYRVGNGKLQNLYQQTISLLQSFSRWTINWIPREQNSHADKLAKQAASNIFMFV